MYPHRIRLRGPWECVPLARLTGRPGGVEITLDPLPAPCRMRMPCRWSEGGLPDFTGRVLLRRRFGYPGQIDAHERVWLTFAGIEGTADISLNNHLVGRCDERTAEYEVTGLLERRNRLDVTIESLSPAAGLWGDVALEVRCTAYLRSVRAELAPAGTFLIAGEVVGAADDLLELYVLHDRHTIAYRTVEAAVEGRPFSLETEEGPRPDESIPSLRVELVNRSTVWYAVELPVFRKP